MLLLTSGRGTNGRLVSLAKLGIFNSQPLDLMSNVIFLDHDLESLALTILPRIRRLICSDPHSEHRFPAASSKE